ncbi:MAG TPA: hypothetical protein IGR64_03630 [Leptolyngbyaceae cyanobacterium M65_K2018_010]|nr:hypothetical protein [Leptolyngbyaceae cyanobacterium M65_K2018_010]
MLQRFAFSMITLLALGLGSLALLSDAAVAAEDQSQSLEKSQTKSARLVAQSHHRFGSGRRAQFR